MRYVVEEKLADRGSSIKATTIGMDVHGYSPEEISDRAGVVRVDAGRVRRKLETYYETEGKTDEIQISLPTGTYEPEIVALEIEKTATHNSKHPKARAVLVVGCTLAIAVGAWALNRATHKSDPPKNSILVDHREIFDISPNRVEAINLATKARGLIFPATDQERLSIALQAFQISIEKDDVYFGGYAGAAQVLGSLALVDMDRERSETNLALAAQHSTEALRLAPDQAWALSAQAWVDFASDNHASALELSNRAIELAPLDPHIREFDFLISLFNSRFEHILDEAAGFPKDANQLQGYVFSNAIGSAQFHTGDYLAAIQTFEEAIAAQGPFGPIPLSYLAAAYEMAGDTENAQFLVSVLMGNWPNARPDILFPALFSDPMSAKTLVEAVRKAGWVAPD
ncbi:tetratricopeptide repeat protein [Shimia sagamensis]|uniref:tetratricopeptide repeat protein n=1 Tax=Shimia sagamensis TaxID=1566352 RepID=UPI0024B6B1D9|nr:tetratricopeptide repeat protein [Shimia sagamensis]